MDNNSKHSTFTNTSTSISAIETFWLPTLDNKGVKECLMLEYGYYLTSTNINAQLEPSFDIQMHLPVELTK